MKVKRVHEQAEVRAFLETIRKPAANLSERWHQWRPAVAETRNPDSFERKPDSEFLKRFRDRDELDAMIAHDRIGREIVGHRFRDSGIEIHDTKLGREFEERRKHPQQFREIDRFVTPVERELTGSRDEPEPIEAAAKFLDRGSGFEEIANAQIDRTKTSGGDRGESEIRLRKLDSEATGAESRYHVQRFRFAGVTIVCRQGLFPWRGVRSR